MLDKIKEFFSNNTTIVYTIIALVIIVGIFMFKRNIIQGSVNSDDISNTFSQMQMSSENVKNDNIDGLCDLETGMCYPQNDTDLQMHQEQHMPQEQNMPVDN
jgi:hypothetical protein